MSDILVEKLAKKYVPTPNGPERILIYAGSAGILNASEGCKHVERVYVGFLYEELLGIDKPFDFSVIEMLANEIFDDIGFEFRHPSGVGNFMNFVLEDIKMEKVDMDYLNFYSGHDFEFSNTNRFPQITISTGNRGRIGLHERQREKYFTFVNGIFDHLMEKFA